MPLIKLGFKPGVNRDRTNYSQEGGWWASDKIRFRQGFPEKIGGWEVETFDQYTGQARSLFTYVTLDGSVLVTIGTHVKMYVNAGTTLYDITPIRATFTSTDTDNCFATTNASTTITATITGHGAITGDYVTFSGATTVGGVPAGELNAEHEITVVNSNTFTFTVSTAATSTVAAGGGTGITAAFQINVGYATATAGYGWGTSTWSRGTWGSGSTIPFYFIPRLQFQDKFNNDLVFNIRDENIYYWVYNTGFSNRAVLLSSLSGAVAVPKEVGKIMFAPSGHLLALACTNYDASAASPDYEGSYDPLLVRWSNVDATVGPEPEKWQPTATNTAGFLRLKSGSRIITAKSTRQEILIWTDFSLSSLQFLGTQEVFGLQELSSNINIMSPNVVAEANNVIYWMGTDKFYAYSGRVDTLPCTLKQYIFDDINREQSDLFFAGTNNEYNEIIWFYVSEGSQDIDRYVIYNHQEQIWYYGTLDRTAWVDAGVTDFPIAVDDGWVYAHEKGNDDGQPLGAAPQPITSYIESADMDIGDGDKFILINRVIPDVNFTDSDTTNSVTGAALTPEVDITVGVRKFPGALPATSDVRGTSNTKPVVTSATIDQYTNQVFLRARGRQMNFKIASDGIGVQWQLGYPRVDGREDGKR
jgi:hypothetical protein